MIRINLLPVQEIKRRNKTKAQLLSLVIGFFLFLTILSGAGLYQLSQISSLQKTISKLQNEKDQYTKILNEIKKLEEEKKLIETRISIIKQLKASSSLTVHVMDEIANLTPLKRMWLTGLSQSGTTLKISGMALDNQTVAKFMDDLEKSQFISNIGLTNSSLKQYAERNLKSFSVTGTAGLGTEKLEDTNQQK